MLKKKLYFELYRVRGTLGTFITVSCNLGIVLGFLAANYMGYMTIPYVMMGIPVIFLGIFVWFPESPNYLMLINEPKVCLHDSIW